MPFTISRFAFIRPFLYHFTALENRNAIASGRELLSAAQSMRFCRSSQGTKREAATRLASGTWLQTQAPLKKGNVHFMEGWTMETLVSTLNEHVFFWPGKIAGPMPYGQRHVDANLWPSSPLAIRIPTADMFSLNESALFCRFNSGSPRCNAGRKSPRGPDTFVTPFVFQGTSRDAVEVVFKGSALLPDSAECSTDRMSTWERLS